MGSGRGPVAREPGEAAQPTQATCHRWPQPRATECAAPCPALHAKTWAACRQVTDGGQKCGQMHPAQAGAIIESASLKETIGTSGSSGWANITGVATGSRNRLPTEARTGTRPSWNQAQPDSMMANAQQMRGMLEANRRRPGPRPYPTRGQTAAMKKPVRP